LRKTRIVKLKEAKRLWQGAQDRFNDVFGQADAKRLRQTLLGIAANDRLSGLKD
jgi:hypothetical protein